MIVAATSVRPMVLPRGAQDQLGMLQVGQVIEARVESTAGNGVVRLHVAGIALHVSSTTKLARGSTIMLLVKQDTDGGLMLELKRSESVKPSMQPTLTHGSMSPVGARGHGLLSTLLDIGAALSASIPGLAGEVGARSTDPTSLTRGDSLPRSGNNEAGTTAAHRMQTVAGLDANLGAIALPHSTSPPPEAEEQRGGSETRPDAMMQIRGSPDQMTATASMVINYVLPGTTELLQIAVSRREEGNDDRHSAIAQKSIKASFTFNSEALGHVHVVMRQNKSAISVGLWAERPEVAAELLRERAELRQALGDADIAVEALEVFIGDPSIAASCFVMPGESVVP